MKDICGKIQYKNKDYSLVFNLNVMEKIQEEYGSLEAWGKLTDGEEGEPNAKAVIFGFTEMLNEGIDIANDENGTDDKPLTLKQVGRMISDYGLENATKTMNKTVIESTKSEERRYRLFHSSCLSVQSFTCTTWAPVPFRTPSAVMITLLIVESEGTAYMISVMIPSITLRRPRAPILRSMARSAMASSASGS